VLLLHLLGMDVSMHVENARAMAYSLHCTTSRPPPLPHEKHTCPHPSTYHVLLNNVFRWTFSCKGECTSIPQLSHLDKAQQGAACSNGRARVAAYPTHVAHGLLWVWPEAGAWEAALAAVPDLDPSLGVISGSEYTDWFVRDVPIRCGSLSSSLVWWDVRRGRGRWGSFALHVAP
jgi:hypothetical protein